jgi:HEAT repeat protein
MIRKIAAHLFPVLVLALALAGTARPASAGETEILTNDDIILLVESGLGEDIIAEKIRTSECRFDVSAKELVRLSKDKKVPQTLIKLMMQVEERWRRNLKGAVGVALQDFLNNDPKNYERGVRALKKLGPAAIGEISGQGLANESPEVRAGAAEALGQIAHRDAIDPLFDALADKDARVRAVAARSLKFAVGEAEREAACKRLTAMLQNLEVPRDGAVLALGHLKEKRAVAEIRTLAGPASAPMLRRAALEALGLMDDKDSVEALIKAVLEDRDTDCRAAAAFSLAQIGDAKAVPALVKAFSDRWPQDRERLVGPLARFRDPRVVEALIGALDDQNPRVGDLSLDALKLLTGENFKKAKQEWESWWELDGRKRFQ